MTGLQMRRLLVTGSRDWRDEARLRESLAFWVDLLDIELLVHGHCPLGADAMADRWALEHMAEPPERWPADWKNLGMAAGPFRNRLMVEAGAEMCLAFPLEHSKGTKGCIELARKAGIPVHIEDGGEMHPGLRSNYHGYEEKK